MSHRTLLVAVAIAGLGAFAPAARADDAATRAQVEQLQKQLDEMRKEMAALENALEKSEANGAADPMLPMMRQHMMGMQQHWQMMHDQTCTMAPGSCPQSGMGMGMGMHPPTKP